MLPSLEHSHVHLFTHCLWLPSHHNSELGKLQQRSYACKTENIYSGTWLLLLLSCFSRVRLYATPQTGLCSPPGSAVPGILQARTLERGAIPSPIRESEKWKWVDTLCLLGWLSPKRQGITNANKDVEKREHLCAVGRNVNWYRHYGKQFGVSSKS